MYADDDWRYEDLVPAKEEPDCGWCCDRGWVRRGWLAGLLKRGERPCPSCNPTRLDILLTRIRNALWNLRYRRRVAYTADEPPF